MCLCLDLCEGLCVSIFLRSPKDVVSDTCFWSFLPHLWAALGAHGQSLYSFRAFIGKELINVSYSDDIDGMNKTGSRWNPLSLPFMMLFQPCVFLSFFPPFLQCHGRPHNPTETYNNKCAVLGSYLNVVYEQKATPDSLQVHNPWNLMPSGGQNWSSSVFHICALP